MECPGSKCEVHTEDEMGEEEAQLRALNISAHIAKVILDPPDPLVADLDQASSIGSFAKQAQINLTSAQISVDPSFVQMPIMNRV